MTPFILGIDTRIDGSAALTSDRVYDLVGHNVGNLAFHYATSGILGGGLRSVSWYAPPEEIDAAGGIGVMPCANQLGPHANYGSLAERFSRLNTRLVAVGLGAQGSSSYASIPEVPEGTLDWIREIARRAPGTGPNIGVRGAFTLEVLEHYGLGSKAVVLGCPTLFINPDPTLGRRIAERARHTPNRVAVAAGHQAWTHLARLEASLTRIMAATDGVYIVQSPKEMVKLARGEAGDLSEQALTACRNYACPELTPDEFTRWSRKYARAFFDVSAWMEYLRGFDFVVGARIHGVMLGLQAGVPSLCIAHDSRTRELCETMKVPFVMASEVAGGMSRDDLLGRFRFDADEFDWNRAALARAAKDFLESNGLRPAEGLRVIAAGTIAANGIKTDSAPFLAGAGR